MHSFLHDYIAVSELYKSKPSVLPQFVLVSRWSGL